MSLRRGPLRRSPVAPPIFPNRILVLTEIRPVLLAKRVPTTGGGRGSKRTNDVEHASITEKLTGSVKATSLERHQPTRARVTSGHGSAPRRWRLMSQARMAAAPTSYARHQAGHQAGTPAFSIKCP